LAIGDVAIRKLFDGIKQTNFNDRLSHIPLTNGNGYVPRKIGEFLPEFEVSDLKGNHISKNDLIDKRTLVTFWSPNCPHCRDLMDEIKIVDREGLPDDTDLIIFSQGDPKEFSQLDLRSLIVVDKGSKVSASLGASGTPSAVLIDRDGRFVTETAIGGKNIWSLVRRDKVQ
jgi:thiol-disulfide isomerase/thioredoxin